jgi:hypothetical protein
MINNYLPVSVSGHVHIEDDLGEVFLDKRNAIHPQNMARVIARALAHEPNSWIGRIAFGNGGTITDAAYQITYRPPNDGIPPDVAGWQSRLHNETYSEFIDESQINIGSGPGSSVLNDPASINNNASGPGVVSNELGLISQVVVTCVLNSNEPSSQVPSDIVGNPALLITEFTETPFTFDEIGLFTTGAPIVPTAGYQYADVGTRAATDITGLVNDTVYVFDIVVDGVSQTISILTPITGSGGSGEILYSDLITLINASLVGATASISNNVAQTYGFLKFTSNTVGATSLCVVTEPAVPPTNWLFDNIGSFLGLTAAVPGLNAGVANDPNNPTTEAERLLAHICFSPILKSANRVFIIKYTLTVSVARSV